MTHPMRPVDMTCDEVREAAGAFVLDALEPAEAAAVRVHLASCADPHAEIAEAGSVLPVLDASVPQVEPSPALKGRIMAAAAADLEARRTGGGLPPVASVATPAAAPAPETSTRAAEPTPFPSNDERMARTARRTSPAVWAVRIAAVLVIGLLGAWNLLLQGQLATAQTYEDNVAAVLEVASQPGAFTAVLAPATSGGPRGLAAMSPSGDMAMAVRDLAPTSGTEVYEAWVIGADGVPVPLGGVPVGSSGIAFYTETGLSAEPGAVLALTLEPGPGATAPSSAPVSSGTVVAATG
jgi:anti-sigma-K factor RskA/putative zinc finger protein